MADKNGSRDVQEFFDSRGIKYFTKETVSGNNVIISSWAIFVLIV